MIESDEEDQALNIWPIVWEREKSNKKLAELNSWPDGRFVFSASNDFLVQ